MALGDNNYSGNGKPKYREIETYSGYNLSNVEGVDPSALSFSYFRELLKVTISPKLQNPSENKLWDHENAASVYLTHTKARMLAKEIDEVLAGNKFNGGVNTGSDGLITFSDGKEVGSNFYCLIIRKIDQSGTVLSTYVYEFKQGYHYSIYNFNSSDSSHEKAYYDMLEIEQLKDLLEQYYEAMTNAIAYTVVNQMRFDMSRINTKLVDIAEANGITYNNNNSSSRGGNRGSFFNGNNNSNDEGRQAQPNRNTGSSRASTIEELEADA